MDEETKVAYSEVSEVLWMLGNEYYLKIPKKLLEYIECNKSFKYAPLGSLENNISELNLSPKAITILSFMYLSYWCDSAEIKNEILDIIDSNSNNYKEFEKIDMKFNNNAMLYDIKKSNMPVKYSKKESIFSKILSMLKKITFITKITKYK